jgi:hypothetical protein
MSKQKSRARLPNLLHTQARLLLASEPYVDESEACSSLLRLSYS